MRQLNSSPQVEIESVRQRKQPQGTEAAKGLWGYVGAVISGVGIGWVAQHHGWGAGFAVLSASAVLSALCFAFTWNVIARGISAKTTTA